MLPVQRQNGRLCKFARPLTYNHSTVYKFVHYGWHKQWRRSEPHYLSSLKLDLPSGELQKLVFESSEAVSVVSTFDDLGLKEDLVRGIYAYSASRLSPLRVRPFLRGTFRL